MRLIKSNNSNLKKSIAVTMISKYSYVVVQLIITGILARFLGPKEFGTIAMITVFTTFFYFISDMGIGPSIIQNRSLDERDISGIFNFSLIIGVVLMTIFYFASFIIGAFFKGPELVFLAQVMSVSVLFSSVTIVPKAILEKNKKFGLVGICVLTAVLVSGGVAIILAISGWGYYALVIQTNANAILLFIFVFIFSKIKIQKGISIDSVKKIWKNSAYQFAFNFVNYFTRNFDNIMVGRVLGNGPLGVYDRAYKLMMYPVTFLPHTIQPVLNSHFSEYQDNKKKIYTDYKKLLLALGVISMPLSVFLFFSAKEVILVMYGSKWLEAVSIFKILAFSVSTQILSSSTGAIYQATGRTDMLFKTGIINSIVAVTGIIISVGFGLEPLAYFIVAAFLLNFMTSFIGLIKFVFNESFRMFLLEIILPIIVLWIVSFFSFFMVTKIINATNIFITLAYKSILFGIFVAVGIRLILLRGRSKKSS